MTDYVPEPGHERFVSDLASAMNVDDPPSLVFSMATYQIFDEQSPTAVLAAGAGDLGLVMWNLGPGQENDYHVHPRTEHVHIVVQGEVEYTLADFPPRTVKVGEAVLVPAGIAHGIRNVSDAPASYLAAAGMTSGYEKILVERPSSAKAADGSPGQADRASEEAMERPSRPTHDVRSQL
jgi:quercetin dioxygenase-like cupin family protein